MFQWEWNTLEKQENQDKWEGRTGKLDGYFSEFYIYASFKSLLTAKLLTPRMCHQTQEGIEVKDVVTVLYS